MKLNVNLATFEAPTASELIKSFWEYNDATTPAEWQEVFNTIQIFVIEEQLTTGFDATLNHEPTMIDLLEYIDAIKDEYDFPVSVEW